MLDKKRRLTSHTFIGSLSDWLNLQCRRMLDINCQKRYLNNTWLENLYIVLITDAISCISNGTSAISWLNESALLIPILSWQLSTALPFLDFDKHRTQITFLATTVCNVGSPLVIQIQAALKLTAEASWRGGGSFKSTGLLKILTWKNTF